VVDILPSADTWRSGVADENIEAGGDNPHAEGYEPPRIDVLGTVNELTRGPAGVGGDVNGMVISF
jgi:hypothetical protein